MLGHTSRNEYYIVSEGKVATGCPFHAGQGTAAAAAPAQAPNYRFDWMYGESKHPYTLAEQEQLKRKLTDLGNLMNMSVGIDPDQSQIPSGYTYLGQFIAHEISFDQTKGLVLNAGIPQNDRSPQIELDSLYGGGPDVDPELFEADHVRLKIGDTSSHPNLNRTFPNDLPRRGTGEKPIEALIGDPRNDENLAVAQTHVAFIKFHNEVVNRLEGSVPDPELFERAREQVVRHFHLIIIKDFLPKVLDQNVLREVLASEIEWCKGKTKDELFMPLEFSAAAFRFGHSLIRNSYEWNSYHTSKPPVNGAAGLFSLFEQTAFCGNLGGSPRLPSDWVIDWRRFFDFTGFSIPPVSEFNFARRIDTAFDMHLDQPQFSGVPREGLEPDQFAITTRNLVRGFKLNLPTGEEVAERFHEPSLDPEKIIARGPYNVESEPHKALFADPMLNGRTPLWYYILKEAEQNDGNHLGRVGSRIIAETLIGLIRNSRYFVGKDSQWRPLFGRPAAAPERFDMVDLIAMGGLVDPISEV